MCGSTIVCQLVRISESPCLLPGSPNLRTRPPPRRESSLVGDWFCFLGCWLLSPSRPHCSKPICVTFVVSLCKDYWLQSLLSRGLQVPRAGEEWLQRQAFLGSWLDSFICAFSLYLKDFLSLLFLLPQYPQHPGLEPDQSWVSGIQSASPVWIGLLGPLLLSMVCQQEAGPEVEEPGLVQAF